MVVVAAVSDAETRLDRHGVGSGQAVHPGLPNEYVDPLSGNLVLVQTDLVLPGNNGMDLRVQRVYNSHIYPDYASNGSTALEEDSWAGAGWSLHYGRVIHADSTDPGVSQIEMGDGSRHALYSTSARAEGWITRDFWVYDRNSNTLKLPNGYVYTFGRLVYLNTRLGWTRYVTEIRDPFNNWLQFTYFDASGPIDGVASVRQYVGPGQVREVTFGHINGNLAWMTYDGRTWSYSHNTTAPGYTTLATVQPPTGQPWFFGYAAGYELTRVVAPMGGQWDYTYADSVQRVNTISTVTRVVRTRALSGSGIDPGTWTYTYAAGSNQDQTVIDCPCGTTRYTFKGIGISGDFTGWSAGLLAERTTEKAGAVLERETLNWIRSEPVSGNYIPGENGVAADNGVFNALLEHRTIARGTQSWNTYLTYHTGLGNYNDFGEPYLIDEQGEIRRITTRTFREGFTPYITHRVATEDVGVGTEHAQSDWTYATATGFLTRQNLTGFVTSFDANAEGNVSTVTDGRGNQTFYWYDWGQVREVHEPLIWQAYIINPDGSVAYHTIGNQTTAYRYDSLGRILSVAPPGSNPTIYGYDNDYGGVYMDVSRGSSTVRSRFDGFGRVTKTTDGTRLTQTFWYDACGRQNAVSVPYTDTAGTLAVQMLYDELGRMTRRTEPDGTVTTYAYDGIDVTVTDAENRATRYDYSAFGTPGATRLMSLTDPAGQVTSYAYEVLGHLIQVVGPGGAPTRTWVYDGRGLPLRETQPESGTTVYNTRDANGNLLQRTDAAGAVTTFTYDAHNRLTAADAPGTADDVTLVYDGYGRLTNQNTPTVSTTMDYDAISRPATRTDRVNGAAFQSAYGYDYNDNLTQLTYPSGRAITYEYDISNRLIAVRNNGVLFADSFQYDDAGRPAAFSTGAVRHTTGYDLASRVARVTSLGPAGGLDVSYGYDPVGQVTSVTDTRAGMSGTFGYDTRGRILTATGPWPQLTWTYDAAGNRLTENRGGTVTNYQYDAPTQRLVGSSGGAAESFTYDAIGRVTSDGRGTYAYTAAGQLRTALGTGMTASYDYDGSGLRITKTVNGVTTYAARSLGGQTLSEYAATYGTPIWTRDLVYAGGRLVGAVKANRPPLSVSLTAAASALAEAAGPALASVAITTPDGAPVACAVTVNYAVQAGTATAGADFTASSGVVTFAAGTASGTAQTIAIPVVNDTTYEPDETFSVVLSSPVGAVLGAVATEVFTIVNDDPALTNQRPAATLTAPASGSSYTVPATVTLQATASDADGTVASVDFYAGSTLLGKDTTSPYSYTWAPPAAGTYALTAVAVDDLGATGTSAAVTVTVQASAGDGVVLLADDFNDGTIDPARWDTTGLFSGTKDATVTVAESGGQLRIGPLASNTAGTHYNGIQSAQSVDFTGGAASVQLATPASASTTAYAMFTVGTNVSNYYRLFVSGSTLVAQKKIGGTKTDYTFAYDAAGDQFLRIRHDAATGQVVWETAPSYGGSPGAWVLRRAEAWQTTAVPLGTVKFELKAGTSDAQPTPGTVAFDNFRAVRSPAGATDALIYASDVVGPHNWRHVADSTAAGGVKLATTNQSITTDPALAAPATYFDVPFTANAGVRYHVWVRLRANANSIANDSVWVQFSDAVSQTGAAIYRTGTTGALPINLEACSGCGVSGWGWQSGAYWAPDTGDVWFATSGSHTLRVQVREDGVELDQVVISGRAYVDASPGVTYADTSIVPRPAGNLYPTATLTAPASGTVATAPATLALQATASDPDGTIARVEFWANAALLGSDTTAPYAWTWSGAAAGTYDLTAVAFDNSGAATSSAAVRVTVQAPAGSETVLLADDFNDNSLNTALWATGTALFSGTTQDPGVAIAETTQQFRIGPLLANATASHYNGIASVATYDVTGAAVQVEVVQPPSAGAVAYAMLSIGTTSSDFYRFFITGTDLVAEKKIAGVKTDVAIPYDASAHRFLRIRHDAATGQVRWETAPGSGGVPGTWTQRSVDTWQASVPLTALRVELKAGTSDPQTSPGTVVFDNVKIARSTAPNPTILFADDFSAASLDAAKWTVAVQSGTRDAAVPVTQGSSRLTIGPLLQGTAGSHYNGILSGALDLTGAAASVEAVTVPPSATTADLMYTLTVDLNNHYRIWVEAGLLRFERKTTAMGKEAIGGVVTFSATNHAYWRIRHDTVWDDMVFETAPKVSGAPGAWTEQARTPRTIPITAIKLELKGGTYQSEATAPGSVAFDSVQVVR